MGKNDTFDDATTGMPEEDFATLFEQSQTEDAAAGVRLAPGEVVRGRIVAISGDMAFVDLGGKMEGQFSLAELGEDARDHVSVGDEVEAYVMSVGDGIQLSMALAKGARAVEQLETAYQARIPVDGRIIGVNKGGLEVTVAGQRAFCPKSQVDTGFVEDLALMVGETMRFVITRFDGGRDIVLSRRALLETENADRAETTKKQIVEGAILRGRVRNVREFGAFIDLGGIDGLVHVSEISWERVSDPREVLKVGDEVQVRVLKADWEAGRISLSIKAALEDPWAGTVDRFREGETYPGKVMRLTEYGAFVELAPGLDGLVHVSELSWKRVRHPSEVVNAGDAVSVRVLGIDRARKRVSLSMKQVGGDPWESVPGRFPTGAVVEGTIEKTEGFGVFVTLAPGITGLIPLSETNTERGTDLRRVFQPGKTISAKVLTVSPGDRRLTLSLKALREDGERRDMEEYRRSQRSEERGPESTGAGGGAGGGFGTFGDLLKKGGESRKKR